MAVITTYKNIQDRILDQLGKSDTTTRNRIKNWINLGQTDFVLRELWPFREATDTITTVAGTQEYTLSSETADLDSQNIISISVQGATNKKIPYIPFNQLRAGHPDFDIDATGVPQNYYLQNGKLGFWPSPDAAYTIFMDYYKLPTELSADADESIIPLSYREALLHYGLSLEHDFNTDPDLAQKATNRYEQIVTLARNNLLTQPNDTGNFRILGPADNLNWTDVEVT